MTLIYLSTPPQSVSEQALAEKRVQELFEDNSKPGDTNIVLT